MRLSDDHITLDLADGRRVRTPLDFYPSLLQSPQRIRDAWEYLGWATGLEWPDLDLQLSVDSIVQGRREVVPPPGFKEETARALAAWRAAKAKRRAKR